ncbi:LysR family transcriptional regulator [Gluconobacter sphaericus]|uniref:LysR family transcriptional regulator n=1 Tax=Gluconobacter sphaericus NBRC 12467 TaxID=1307951 RepID=A0AA37SGW6_9PROT|nr:LysR family transcriptional regulator [Gluconobacter sphaericus]MBF0884833.1 LysR family transcriptional regulator [Gluconobacter sphaericus]MBS1085675.1 LysR family transcriptional regulator [Gluconobacter sphaericus]MBS1099986.1 LysR family transcriptional regulator [Gluconobacter sphaericus]GBR54154.1 LysR family transcriptional regulator [Gluconobacter sphaericus NBRC 12467]GEB43764.1 LysR family transcriptional regulator [Gluconobacter sphaericus NBRC 12467]
MDTHIPDWHLFRAFLAVVREGSLSGAARMLATTQPTMGRQVAALEASLGVKLFTRSIDGLSPTEAGLRLIPSAEAMAAAAETAWRSTSGKADEARGTVRITASEVIGSEVLPSLLTGFYSLYPQISVELVLSNRNEDLLRGDADIAVRMVRPSQAALVAKRIGNIDAGLYAHQHYLKKRPMPQCLYDLRQHALIGYDRNPAHSRMIEMMRVPLTREMFAFRSDSDLAQLAALRTGFGIGASQLGIAKRDRNLIPVLHTELIFSMDVWVAIHPDMRSDRRIRLMFDYLVKKLAHYAMTSRHET